MPKHLVRCHDYLNPKRKGTILSKGVECSEVQWDELPSPQTEINLMLCFELCQGHKQADGSTIYYDLNDPPPAKKKKHTPFTAHVNLKRIGRAK